DADVTVGGVGGDPGACLVHPNVPVGRVDPQLTGDFADPTVPVGVLDDGRSVDLAYPDPAGSGVDFGVAAELVHDHRACAGEQDERAGLTHLDIAGRGLDPAVTEPAQAVEGADRGVRVQVRAGR